ncbi:MAG: hypothetical protein ISS79_12860 [Phycisphaerae bacterium]|nr:hypothetical protein [Phycisphaerae bacterium]
MARRMPISLVRSVTDTSIMFIMPIPPTSRLTAATALSKAVKTRVVPVSMLAISFISITWKSSSSFEDMCRRSRIRASISSWTFSVDASSPTETWMRLMSFFPEIRL